MAENKENKKDAALPKGEHGTEYLSWEYSGYRRYERGRTWYVVMGLFGFGLLIYALLSANFLFALIIIMFGLIIYLSSINRPEVVKVAITEEGVEMGEVFYRYRDIAHFWFAYEPPDVKNLYLDFRDPWRSRAAVELEDIDPNEVRQVIGSFLVEDLTKDEEPVSDTIGRILKI